jgi:uncharacterized protein
MANETGLNAFKGQKYLNLETYRKTGQAMLTPVWFVEEGGVLYIRTLADAGKVKRVRNNPAVRVAPCDMRGRLTGEWQHGQASVLDRREDARISAMLDRKYGLMKRLFELFSKRANDVIRVVLA